MEVGFSQSLASLRETATGWIQEIPELDLCIFIDITKQEMAGEKDLRCQIFKPGEDPARSEAEGEVFFFLKKKGPRNIFTPQGIKSEIKGKKAKE